MPAAERSACVCSGAKPGRSEGCPSLNCRPTARSSPARALPSSAETWAIWSCTWRTSLQRREDRCVIDVGLGVVASRQLEGFAGARLDAVSQQGQDVGLNLGLDQKILDLTERRVSLGLVQLGVGAGPLFGLENTGLVLLVIDRQVETDEETHVGHAAGGLGRDGVGFLHIHVGHAEGDVRVKPLSGQLDGLLVARDGGEAALAARGEAKVPSS